MRMPDPETEADEYFDNDVWEQEEEESEGKE